MAGRTRMLRSLLLGMIIALMSGVASISAEETDIHIDASAAPNVCAVVVTSEAPTPFVLNWTGTEWPANQVFSLTVDVRLSASGGPGDRTCAYTLSNDDFTLIGDDSVMLLPSTALLNWGVFPLPETIIWTNFPIGSPLNSSIPFQIKTTGINQNAPLGVYQSILTITFVAPSP